MKSDPAEDIIKILYGPLEGKIYSIIKSKKKITDAGIYSILLNVPKENINAAIKSLIHEEFIEAKELVYLKDPKLPKTQKNKIIENQLIYKENYDFDNLFNAYNTLKNEIKKDFNSKEELKYECEKCQKKLDENMASRDNFKCPKCGERYKEIKNNLAELKKRCNEIFEVLDDRFDRKLGGLNKKSHANNMDYYPQGLKPYNKRSKSGNKKGKDGTHWRPSIDGKAYIQKYTNYPTTVLHFKKPSKAIHPTQKPVDLLEYLIKTYTNEDETVLDNCMGSGSTGVACVNTNRDFIGIELDENYFNIAQKRINQAIKNKGGE